MFKKLSNAVSPGERPELFNLLKFFLAFSRRLAEPAVLLAWLAFWDGDRNDSALWWRMDADLGRPPPGLEELWLSAPMGDGALALIFIVLGLILLSAALPRWLFLAVEASLTADFGLNSRPARAGRELRRLLGLWLLSFILYEILAAFGLLALVLAALALGGASIILETARPGLLGPRPQRPLAAGELSPDLRERFSLWADRLKFRKPALMVDLEASPFLEPPRLTGLGPALTLEIPERALAAFPPRALALMTTAALLEAPLKAAWKFVLLRLCALAAAMSLAAALIASLGYALFRYPRHLSPDIMILVWLAGWLGLNLADFCVRLLRRDLETHLAAAAAQLLKDEEALETALEVLAARNLEEEKPPAWREIFRRRFSRPEFLKRCRTSRASKPPEAAAPTPRPH